MTTRDSSMRKQQQEQQKLDKKNTNKGHPHNAAAAVGNNNTSNTSSRKEQQQTRSRRKVGDKGACDSKAHQCEPNQNATKAAQNHSRAVEHWTCGESRRHTQTRNRCEKVRVWGRRRYRSGGRRRRRCHEGGDTTSIPHLRWGRWRPTSGGHQSGFSNTSFLLLSRSSPPLG